MAAIETWAGYRVRFESRRNEAFPLFSPGWTGTIENPDREKVGEVCGAMVDGLNASTGRQLRSMLSPYGECLRPLFDFRTRGPSAAVLRALGLRGSEPGQWTNPLRFLYLEEVSVDPTHRGFGLGKFALWRAVREMAGRHCEFAVLDPFPLLTLGEFFAFERARINAGAAALRKHWASIGFRDVPGCSLMIARTKEIAKPPRVVRLRCETCNATVVVPWKRGDGRAEEIVTHCPKHATDSERAA